MIYNRYLLLSRSAELNDTVRADVAAAEAITLTTSAATVGANSISVADPTGVILGHRISGPGIAADTLAAPQLEENLVILTNPVSSKIESGVTLDLAAPATEFVTTGTTDEAGTSLISDRDNIYFGQIISGTNIAEGSFVQEVSNSNTIISSLATTGSIESGATITLTTASSVVIAEGAIFEDADGAVVVAAPSDTIGIIPGQRAIHPDLPAKSIVYLSDPNTGQIVLAFGEFATGTIAMGDTITLELADELVTNAATDPGADYILHFADTSGIAEGMVVHAERTQMIAGTTVVSFDSTTVELSDSIDINTAVHAGESVQFRFLGLADTVGIANSIANVVAINATQSFVDFRLTSDAGVNLNVGDLRAYANSIAADLESSTGKTFALESAVRAGNSLLIRFLTNY